MTDQYEQVDRARLFEFVREAFAQSQVIAEVQRETLVQLEANTEALNQVTAVIKAVQRDFRSLHRDSQATKKKSLGLRRRLSKGLASWKIGSRCFRRRRIGSKTS